MNAISSKVVQLLLVFSLTGIALGQTGTVDRTNSDGTVVVTDATTFKVAATDVAIAAINDGDTFTIKNGNIDGGGAFDLTGHNISIVSDGDVVRRITSNGARFFSSRQENDPPKTVTISVKNITFDSGATGVSNGGGAIYVGDGDNLQFYTNNATFSNNSSNNTGGFGNGGAIVENNGRLTIQSADGVSGTTSFFISNIAKNNGGAIYTTGKADIHNASFASNTAGNAGGAVYGVGDVTLSDSSFTANRATVNGGAIYAIAKLVISGTNTFGSTDTPALGNTAVSGGAIASTSDITFSGTNVFANNTATGTGGAIYTTGAVTISGNNTFSNNKATGDAGGAISISSGALTFSGEGSVATFSGNTQKNSTNNDIYVSGDAKDITFTDNGMYTFSGGIVAPGIVIEKTANVSFEGSAINSSTNMTISGLETKASFGANTTNTSTGTVTISNTAKENVTFSGTQNFATLEFTDGGKATFDSTSKNTATNVTISGDTSEVTFSGTQNFANLKFANGGKATFDSNSKNTSSNLVTITGNTSQVTFQGTQDFTRMVVENRGTAVLEINSTNQIDVLEVATGGTVNIFTDDQHRSATITGKILVQSGGIVNVSGKDAKLIVAGEVSGAKNAHMNLAIYNTMEQANKWYYGVAGQTLKAESLSGEGGIVVNASGFNYHDETEKFSLITITGAGNGYTLEEYEQLISLPFAWFGELGDILNVNGVDYSKEYKIFKIDGDKIPEPSTWALLILGIIGLALYRRKASGVKA